MLSELYKRGYLDYTKMILDNSKPLGLNAAEAFILIKILDNYRNSSTLSLEELSSQILMNTSSIDKTVANLMERGYYEVFISYENGIGQECISFRPLFEMLDNIINNKLDLDKYDIEKANQYLVKSLNRVLTASELEILQGMMVDDHYTYDEIVTAIDSIVRAKRVLSMRTLTTALANKKQEVTAHKEAPKAFKDFINKI